MAQPAKYHIDVEIDKLTNSIVNTISGDSFPTDVHLVTKADLKNMTKSKGWLFNWASEVKQSDRQVYKLTIRNNPEIIQGLLSISDFNDHFYLHLIESAAINYMKEFPVIYLLSPAKLHGTKDMKDSSPLLPRPN